MISIISRKNNLTLLCFALYIKRFSLIDTMHETASYGQIIKKKITHFLFWNFQWTLLKCFPATASLLKLFLVKNQGLTLILLQEDSYNSSSLSLSNSTIGVFNLLPGKDIVINSANLVL